MSTSRLDLLVVGGGPAGLALAAASSDEGLDVGVLSPSHPPAWPNNYGAWLHEFEDADLATCTDERWPNPVVVYERGDRETLDRTYVRLDNEALRGELIERCESGDVQWHTGWASDVEHEPQCSRVARREGESIEATLVVDATGPSGALLSTSSSSRDLALQTAHGIVARCQGNPLDGEEMCFMDYTRDHLPESSASMVPSFLYGMHLGGDRYFLEETRLADDPPVSHDRLQVRLKHRLNHRGVEVLDVEETERVSIPMNLPLPDRSRRILGFGAAAAMIHPASGFSLTRTFRRAPRVADALAEALGSRGASPHRAARNGWRAVWPDEHVRTRQLQLFGLDMMLELDAETLPRFFESFFSVDEAGWTDYLKGDTSPRRTAQIMLNVFQRAPFSLQRAITSTSISPSVRHLVRGLLSLDVST